MPPSWSSSMMLVMPSLGCVGKLLILLLLLPTLSFGQITINQQIVEAPPYKVGDIITIRYNVNTGTQSPRYLWVRYQYNNKILTPVANSTIYSQGTSVQTFSTEWANFRFTPNPTKPSTSLYDQYQLTPWNYASMLLGLTPNSFLL